MQRKYPRSKWFKVYINTFHVNEECLHIWRPVAVYNILAAVEIKILETARFSEA